MSKKNNEIRIKFKLLSYGGQTNLVIKVGFCLSMCNTHQLKKRLDSISHVYKIVYTDEISLISECADQITNL